MGATSTQGTGIGAAAHKGPHNGRDTYVPMVSPHVVCAGTVTTAEDGTATVTFPTALSVDHAVLITAVGISSTHCYVVKSIDEDGVFSGFDLTAENDIDYDWVVINYGYGA